MAVLLLLQTLQTRQRIRGYLEKQHIVQDFLAIFVAIRIKRLSIWFIMDQQYGLLWISNSSVWLEIIRRVSES